MNDGEMIASKDNGTVLPDLGMSKMLRTRVRYFTDGAVIGRKSFVNETFDAARERFSEKRKDGLGECEGVGRLQRGSCGALGICGSEYRGAARKSSFTHTSRATLCKLSVRSRRV